MVASFSAQIRAFETKTVDQLERITKEALQDLMEDAQTPVTKGGNMPVEFGFLRNSITGELDGGYVAGGESTSNAEGDTTVLLTIANYEIGQTVRFNWIADYARARHYKGPDFGQGGGMWRDIAAAKWQQFVDGAARRVK